MPTGVAGRQPLMPGEYGASRALRASPGGHDLAVHLNQRRDRLRLAPAPATFRGDAVRTTEMAPERRQAAQRSGCAVGQMDQADEQPRIGDPQVAERCEVASSLRLRGTGMCT